MDGVGLAGWALILRHHLHRRQKHSSPNQCARPMHWREVERLRDITNGVCCLVDVLQTSLEKVLEGNVSRWSCNYVLNSEVLIILATTKEKKMDIRTEQKGINLCIYRQKSTAARLPFGGNRKKYDCAWTNYITNHLVVGLVFFS